MNGALKFRLGSMMFLQFFIWGGWFVTLGSYLSTGLKASGAQSALAYSTQSWGAVVAPFIVGLLADRYVRAERLLGAIHLIGCILMAALYRATRFEGFYPCLLAYMILYMPTLALVNAIAFRQMNDPAAHFARIRVWGTVGWVVAGVLISQFGWDSQPLSGAALSNTFLMCSIASLALGIYSFTLPPTPPLGQGRERLKDRLGFEALVLLRDRNFLLFFVASILICIPLAFYYQNANQFLTEIKVAHATAKQALGQVSEVLFMLLIPLFLTRFGMKATLLAGMFAWACRYVLFAFGDAHERSFMLLLGIALHGVCYDFFFVSGQIYTDSKAGSQYKTAAQGMVTLATYGVGMLIGFWAAGRITDAYAVAGMHAWRAIWIYPALFAALVFLGFGATFRNETVAYSRAA